ncbi:MAG: DNA-3-methyladenine glycosylase [Bacteroidota bacterium]
MEKLSRDFYLQQDVVSIARQLLGKLLVTEINGRITSGYIVETEAYAGVTDKASHAFGGRRTPRTEIMYRSGGTAYVYFCYGMHSLFNVVTNQRDIPHAVLIRAIQPVEGLDIMMKRANKSRVDKTFANGPGKVAKILGINTTHTDFDLCNSEIEIFDIGKKPSSIVSSPRIGVDYAGEDALLPYRFVMEF